MNFIERYDEWVRARVKDALDWLFEWLSVSQKAVERILIITYVVGRTLEAVAEFSHRAPRGLNKGVGVADCVFSILIVLIMLGWHFSPKTERIMAHVARPGYILRIMWQPLVIATAADLEIDSYHIGHFAQVTAFTLALYVFACNSDGQRGRKRKMAWAKLKELFSWLPNPQPEGV
jgi:hypothetical protein